MLVVIIILVHIYISLMLHLDISKHSAYIFFIYFKTEREKIHPGGTGRESRRERIPTGSVLLEQSPMQILIPEPVRSCLAPKSSVGHLTD